MFDRIRWKMRGSPTISYPGYNCGLCGDWVDDPFQIIDYRLRESVVYKIGDNLGPHDQCHTWGICPECILTGRGNGEEE